MRHFDLGKEGDKPRRTGAFVNHEHHVLFFTGKDTPHLVIVNAEHADTKPELVPLATRKGTQRSPGNRHGGEPRPRVMWSALDSVRRNVV